MKNNQGFTLIELLVVVLIIGILSAIALPQYTQAVEKSRAAEALSNIGSFKRAIDIWKLANPGKSRSFSRGGYGAGELDIEVGDEDTCTKNFCYNVNTYHVEAHRHNSSTYRYYIEYRLDDHSYVCHASNSESLKICKALSDMEESYCF